MTDRAVIHIKDYRSELLSFTYSLKKDIDADGRPGQKINSGFISFEIESNPNFKFIEWMADFDDWIEGKITCYISYNDQKVKQIYFKQSQIISYKETFDQASSIKSKETIVISAKELTIGKNYFTKNWLD